jgi:hypothetical protein
MNDAVQLIYIPELQPEYCMPYGPCNFQKEADSFDATMKAVLISMLLLTFKLSSNKPFHWLKYLLPSFNKQNPFLGPKNGCHALSARRLCFGFFWVEANFVNPLH